MNVGMKWFTVLTVLSLGTMGLTACGKTQDSKVQDNKAQTSATNSSPQNDKNVTLTIATVNNPGMQIMQKLSPEFEKQTGIKLKWMVLPENDLRKKLTEDVALGGGQFDIATVGLFDTAIWAKNKWLEPLSPYFDKMSAEDKQKYDIDDIFKNIKDGLSFNNQLYGVPFDAESSMLYYNTDMLKKANVSMPENPTWTEVADIAKKVKAANNVPGIVLRGKPGWGEGLAVMHSVINAFGGSWYDMNWNAQLNSPKTVKAIKFYVDLLKESGEPGATGTAFTEGLTLMQTGKAAMWYDSTVAAGFLNDPKNSSVAGKIGYALAPKEEKDNIGWLWSWALGIESASKHKEEAFKFITWATSKEYIKLVGEKEGWGLVPPGTRQSTYQEPKYREAAPFAQMVLNSILHSDYMNPAKDPVPYHGNVYVAIPEYQELGNEVSQSITSAIAGDITVEAAMEQAQKLAQKVAVDGGYKK